MTTPPPPASTPGLASFGGGTLHGATASLRKGDVVFQRYTLSKVLGVGGMGVVWLGRDEKLDQDVALKFIAEALVHDVEAIQDLKNQTKLGLKLTRDTIVRILGFESDEKSAAIVMEYVDGATLAAMRVDQPSQVFEADSLHVYLLHILDALEYAHDQESIVHRDLKPANIMVNSQDRLKVADFGIACSLRNSVQRHTIVPLRTGSGTLHYMSPQQLLGGAGCIADDIYSLGATVFELMTGTPPFHSGDVATQIREIPAPTMTSRRQQNRLTEAEAIPDPWEEVVAAALSKDPSHRPSNAAEFRKGLLGEPFRRGTGTGANVAHAPAPVPTAPAPQASSISKSVLAGSCMALLLGGGAAAYMLKEKPVDVPVPDPLVEQLKSAKLHFSDEIARAESFENGDSPAKTKLAKWTRILSEIRGTDLQADPSVRSMMQRVEDRMDHWKEELRKEDMVYTVNLGDLRKAVEDAGEWSAKKEIGATSKVDKWNDIVRKFTPIFARVEEPETHVAILADAAHQVTSWQEKAEKELPKILPAEGTIFNGSPVAMWKDYGRKELLKGIQSALAYKINPMIKPTGTWDEATFHALVDLQREKELPMTGVFDPLTMEMLGLQHPGNEPTAPAPVVVKNTSPSGGSGGSGRSRSSPAPRSAPAPVKEESNPWSRAIQQRIASGGSLPTPGGFPR